MSIILYMILRDHVKEGFKGPFKNVVNLFLIFKLAIGSDLDPDP